MSKPELKVVSPDGMSLDEMFAFIQEKAEKTSCQFAEAEHFASTMKEYHSDMATLMEEVQKLRSSSDAESKAEAVAAVEAAVEIVEAIERLRAHTFSPSTDLEEIEKELIETEEGEAARSELVADTERFMKNYISHKARLGLNTQEDVAKLVGIDRRHISAIESGRRKPQFKTIKKIADAFGVSVKDLI